ncbi:MAG TPA: hypothetical protein VG871_23520 [Vicinamibacterales bacterium]|nr:hypothetical protein [Vicinamibacterales bacterium]
MKPSHLVSLAALAIALSSPAAAQWPDRQSPKVPRTADGKVNFDAPPPRAADGHVDLTGVYENLWFYEGKIGQPPASPPGEPPQTTFAEIGAGFKDGLPFQPWARALHDQRKASNAKDNPDAHCLPMGLMQFHIHPQPRKIVQTPDLIIILYEGNAGIRQIFTDGRALPKIGDVQPWWYGYSVGHWEGDTLVVQTNNFRDDGWLDINGSPLTDQATLTERYQRLSYGTLRVDVTIDDPKAYTRPFTVRLNQKVVPDEELIEFICAENERSTAHMVGK